MKLAHIIFFISFILYLAFSLQLTSPKENHQDITIQSSQKKSYYGPYYRSHRSEEYVEEVKAQNLKKIEQFNNNNKKRLRAGPGGSTVTGGNSFVMGETKFIEFTQEQFIKLFTGYKDPNKKDNGEAHAKNSHKMTINNLGEQSHSQSNQIFSRHFLGKFDPKFAHTADQVQSHFELTQLRNQELNPQLAHDKNIWQFDDPYQIDNSYLTNLYGSVNSDDNYGWNWEDFDQDYYNDFSNDYANYWNDWQDDHWGYDMSQKGWNWESDDSWFGNDQGWANTDDSKWWNDWSKEQQKNQNNQNWWDNDNWNSENNNDDWNKWDDPSNFDNNDYNYNSNDQGNDQIDKTPSPPQPSPKPPTPPTPPAPPVINSRSIQIFPDNTIEVNWILKNATTPVKTQGQCGSCWTFSTIALVESYFLIMGVARMDLSEQQLVDCQTDSGSGCDGGWPANALQFASKNGIVAEEKYPYRGVQQKCAHPTGPHKPPLPKHVVGRAGIQAAIRRSPATVALYVDDGFQFYKQGIFDKCLKEDVNHAVVIVGFTKDYWIIRNSWGKDWGKMGIQG